MYSYCNSVISTAPKKLKITNNSKEPVIMKSSMFYYRGTASESDRSDQSCLPDAKAAKTAAGRRCGQGRGVPTRSALNSAGYGTHTGRGSQKAKSAGGSNEFTSKAFQNKYY